MGGKDFFFFQQNVGTGKAAFGDLLPAQRPRHFQIGLLINHGCRSAL